MAHCGTGTLGTKVQIIGLFLFRLSLISPLTTNALSTGEKTASTTISTGSWVSCNASTLQSANSVRATGSGGNTCEMGGLGMSIPSSTTIDGITLTVVFACRFSCLGTGGASADVYIGTSSAMYGGYSTGFTEDSSNITVILGNATDKWGGTWTYTDFASSSIRYALTDFNSGGAMWVDKVTMNVYYSSTTPPTPTTTSATSSPSQTNTNIGYAFVLFMLGLITMKLLYDKRN